MELALQTQETLLPGKPETYTCFFLLYRAWIGWPRSVLFVYFVWIGWPSTVLFVYYVWIGWPSSVLLAHYV